MGSITLNESLILEFNEPMTDREILPVMTDHLCEKSIVKDTHKQTILERKQSFPTGLKTGGTNVATPHADIYHVNEAAVCVAVLKTPAPSRAMDESDNDIPVSLVIMLVLIEAHGHTGTLRGIARLIQNQGGVKHIVEAGQPDIIHKIIKQYLLEDGNQKQDYPKENIKVKRILVICGNEIATSTVVVTKIREKCEGNGIPVSVTQCRFLEVESKIDDFDLLVTTGRFTGDNVNVSVVGAIFLLTGINEDTMLNEPLSYPRQRGVQIDNHWL